MAKGNCFVKLELLILQGVRSMSMMKEFREFAMRGNVVDLAVGVISGACSSDELRFIHSNRF